MAATLEACGVCQTRRMDADDQEHLAFAGSSDLVAATSRRPFRTADGGALLNVEIFEPPISTSEGNSTCPILLFLHGICESAETKSVQFLAAACQSRRWKLFVLELEGHGLSSGRRAVNGDFNRLCRHVQEFVKHSVADDGAPFALCGTSLGGVLAAYGAEAITTDSMFDGIRDRFLGVAAIAPAVGINPDAIPPWPVTGALRILAAVAPSSGVLTPVEDPSHYACPASSTRNFNGNWPLATSKMLLDVTSKTVRKDQDAGRLKLDVPGLLVIAAEKDDIVPIEATKEFYGKASAEQKEFMSIPNADHGLMFGVATAEAVINSLFDWLLEQLSQQRM